MTASQERMELHHLRRPMRPRDAEAETRGQRLADVEAEDRRSGGQGSGGQRGPESESGGPRLAELGLEPEDK